MKLPFFIYHYFSHFLLLMSPPYVTGQDNAETPHKIICFLLHTYHNIHNPFVLHHLLSELLYPQRCSSQTNRKMSWYILHQKNMLSSFPTFSSTQNNAGYQTFYFYTAKVVQCIFVQYKYVADQDFWHSLILGYCSTHKPNQKPEYLDLDWSFHLA